MESDKSPSEIPFEYAATAGIALALSGQFPLAVIAAVVWFILSRIKSGVPFTIALAASLRIGTVFLGCLAVNMGMVSLRGIADILAMGAVALLLYFTSQKIWAYIMLAHSAYVVGIRIVDLNRLNLSEMEHKALVGALAVQFLIILLLVLYLFAPAKQTATPAIDTPDKQQP